MNTATDIRLESDDDLERGSDERRRGLRLVGVGSGRKMKRPFTITISNEMFGSHSTSTDVRSDLASGSSSERSDPLGSGISSNLKLTSLAAGIVVAGALILGYLAIRKRD